MKKVKFGPLKMSAIWQYSKKHVKFLFHFISRPGSTTPLTSVLAHLRKKAIVIIHFLPYTGYASRDYVIGVGVPIYIYYVYVYVTGHGKRAHFAHYFKIELLVFKGSVDLKQ